jgi:hypothetical protein
MLGASFAPTPAEACGRWYTPAPFLKEGAHVDLASAAWQEFGVKPSFGLSGMCALDLPLLVAARPSGKTVFDHALKATSRPAALLARLNRHRQR